MKKLVNYINENLAFLVPAFKKLGIILLSVAIPFFISLGIKITSLKLDNWINKLINKYPQHKDAILILANVVKDHLKDMSKCNDFVVNTERQKPSKLLTVDDIKKEILPLISNEDDKKKVEDFLNLIETPDFKEEIDECIKSNIKNMITEGLNININDIEDDDLRKEVIKYFKTFKKGKLDDEDLDKLKDADEKEKSEDDEEKPEDEKKEEFSDDDLKGINKVLQTGLMESLINEESEESNQSDEEIENNMKQTLIAMQTLINTTKKDKKKERLQQHYDFIKNSCFDENGKFIKDPEERQKRGDDSLEKMSTMQKIRLVGTLSNSSSKEAQDDLKSMYPDEWDKCEKEINKSIKTSKKEDVEKDEDGNILKQEEITDKDGKKKKVTTHTGPRGGKFYYPDGAPKDAEHKVYVDKDGKVKESLDLKDYLYNLF